MTRLGRNRRAPDATAPENGTGAPDATYCAICGEDANREGPAIGRFDEVFCSEGHAEQFVTEVRSARVQAAATATTEVEQTGDAENRAPHQRNWKAYLGKALCWGAPLLAIVILLGGGSAMLGAASALLPVLAVLACPLGMYLMMRSMSKTGHQEDRQDRGGQK